LATFREGDIHQRRVIGDGESGGSGDEGEKENQMGLNRVEVENG